MLVLPSHPGASDASRGEGHSGDMAAVVVPVLFLLLLGVCGGLVVLYLRHRRLQNNFTAFANSHYNSRLGSAIFSSGDELGKTTGTDLSLPFEFSHFGLEPANLQDIDFYHHGGILVRGTVKTLIASVMHSPIRVL